MSSAAITLRAFGVTHFPTPNEKHSEGFRFDGVWSPFTAE